MALARMLASLTALAWPAAATAASEPPTLEVEYGGCAAVHRGPVCLLGNERTLHIWVQAPVDSTIELAVDGTVLTPGTGERQQLGILLQPAIPDGARVLELSAHDRTGTLQWRLALGKHAEPAHVQQIRTLIASGDYGAARELATVALAELPARQHGAVLGELARIELRENNRDTALVTIRRAITQDLAAGELRQALSHTNILAFLLINDARRFDQVREIYTAFLALPDRPAEVDYFSAYYIGWAASDAGDSRAALDALSKAAAQAERMGWMRRRFDAEQAMFLELVNLGRHDEARALLQPWHQQGLPAELAPCERAYFLNNVAWAELLALEAGQRRADPTAQLEQALPLYDRHCSTSDRINVRLNQALAHYHAGRFDAARAVLDETARLAGRTELRLELWRHDIASRVALARGDTDAALAALKQLETIAALSASPSARWRAAVGTAAVLEHRGQTDAAIAAYNRANDVLDSDMRRIPFFEGRELLVASRARAIEGHIGLLLDAGRYSDAYQLARASRARVLRMLGTATPHDPQLVPLRRQYRALREQLEAQFAESWRLPRNQRQRRIAAIADRERDLLDGLDRGLTKRPSAAAPPADTHAEGEVRMAFHPLGDAWVAFASSAQGLQAHHPICAGLSGAALGSCLLEPSKDTISQAGQLQLLTLSKLQNLDFHALPFGAGQLIDTVSVVYALDLGDVRETDTALPTNALLVADPNGNLPQARAEIELVDDLLGATGRWTTQRLTGRAARATAVRTALGSARLFHYAGHARYAGRGGWHSELQLSARTSVDLADILALPAAPELVVLSGCETALAAEAAAPIASIGIGQAFLLSGTTHVLATARPVADETARALMQRFYAEWTEGIDVARALREAQVGLRSAKPAADWAAFRLLAR